MSPYARFAAALLMSVLAASVFAQSLADVARKEEERRKELKEPSKVISNKDLGAQPAAPRPQPPAADKPSEASKAAGKDAAAKDKDKDKDKKDPAEPPKDQAYWAGRMKALQVQLDRDKTYSDALQSRINALSADFVNRDDPAQRAVIERDRQKAVAELNRLKEALVADKKALDDLAEEARRAGVPPGWLR